jgi:hypothetical protein
MQPQNVEVNRTQGRADGYVCKVPYGHKKSLNLVAVNLMESIACLFVPFNRVGFATRRMM